MHPRNPPTFLLVALALWALLPLRGHGNPDAQASELRVMSFNIRYGTAPDGGNAWLNRREFLLDTIKDFDPDLLGMQECLAAQADFLRAALPRYGFVGVGREDGGQEGEMCAIFFRAERFRKIAEGHFWLSDTPREIGSRSWDSALPRIASWVRLQARADSLREFCFLNTHFDHVGAEARLNSARLIRDRLAAICDGVPVLVAGDFNAPADPTAEGPYQVLTGGTVGSAPGFIDTFAALHEIGPGQGTFNGFRGETDGPRIDWILISPDLTPVTAAIIRTHDGGRYPSDHFPVTAEIRFPRPGADQEGDL